ncbi:hypothetical protein [uncultured Gimesia sp.]|uniref:beta strand repeat-containing protein n=1 Tax=uncultured Gimesia sp. TaxID=1678688 RepID=UPI0030D8AE43|tara:strand:+ start:100326 stop:103223 length:2898 start_codon:yes stop_codon:yes gene_type:complete
MASHIWIGGAPEVPQVDSVTIPEDVDEGQIFTASIGFKNLTYVFPAGPTRLSVSEEIVAMWNASLIPEFAEIVASLGLDIEGNPDGTVKLTARTAGKPFIVTFVLGAGTNEIQTVTLGNAPSGGTFTLTYAGQTTGNIAYNASAATVDSALETLSNIGSGDVTVTGSDGGPWTVEFTGALAAANVADLTADASGLTGTNEQQAVTLNSATGGTFTLIYAGQTTGNIAYNASAATVETALEALSNIGSGNVSVAGSDGGPYTITFIGTLGSTNVNLITLNGTNLTGTVAASISETTSGAGGASEIWHLSMYNQSCLSGSARIGGSVNVTSGAFTIQLQAGSNTVMQTGPIAFDATPQEVMDAFEATDFGKAVGGEYPLCFAVSHQESLGSGNLSDGNDYLLWWHPVVGGALSGYTLTIDSTSLVGGVYAESGVGGLGGLTEAEPTLFTSFYINVSGEETGDIPHNASAATIQASLESLSNVGVGNVTVTTSSPNPLDTYDPFVLRIAFVGDLANQDTGLVINIATHNTGIGGIEEDEFYTTIGNAGTAEVQELSITGSPSSGTFSLTYAGQSTGNIAYNADAAAVQSALEALSTIGAGNVICSGGALPDTPIVITFAGELSGVDLDDIETPDGVVLETVQGSNTPSVGIATLQEPLDFSTVTVSEGPNHWDTSENWNLNTLPVNGDTVYISDTDTSILYGLDQSAVTLAALHVEQTFSGTIGLPRLNSSRATSYFEYRDNYLQIGVTNLFIGDKEGDGSDRIKIDFGSVQMTSLITDSGDGPDGNTPAILLLGTHANNVININRGSLGLAYYPTEVSTIATLRQAFFDDSADDTNVYLGSGVTITDIVKTGGVLDINSATTTFKQTAGTTTVHSGAHAALNILAGLLNYNSTGALTVANISGDTVLVFDQDARPKTVTKINKYTDDSEIYDVSGSIVNPIIDLHKCGDLSTLNMGQDFKVTIGATT